MELKIEFWECIKKNALISKFSKFSIKKGDIIRINSSESKTGVAMSTKKDTFKYFKSINNINYIMGDTI